MCNTKQELAARYGITIQTLRNWVNYLVDSKKVTFTRDDYKRHRILPNSIYSQIIEKL